jgi:hypothetical protein
VHWTLGILRDFTCACGTVQANIFPWPSPPPFVPRATAVRRCETAGQAGFEFSLIPSIVHVRPPATTLANYARAYANRWAVKRNFIGNTNNEAGEKHVTRQPNPPQNSPASSSTPSPAGTLFLIFFGGIGLALAGFAFQKASDAVMNDPYAGCNNVGCAPGLLGFAALFCYIVAVPISVLAFIGLFSLLSRALGMLVGIFGAVWLIGEIVLIFYYGFRIHSELLSIFLILTPILLIFLGSVSAATKEP